MEPDITWLTNFKLDIEYGYVGREDPGPGTFLPRLVLNSRGSSVEHALVEELRGSDDFTFSVAFISPGAIAQLKQHFLDFTGLGRIITSDFLGFNQPEAFAELLHLRDIAGIDVRRHTDAKFHPKGYIFKRSQSVTAMIGSANLTSSALSQNHEWNLKVSAASGSDLALQLAVLVEEQLAESIPLTREWIDHYAARYVPIRPSTRTAIVSAVPTSSFEAIEPNAMQQEALLALDQVREQGAKRAIVISATGTGKTMLSALDVRGFNATRLLFIVHREQILDRTIKEYQRVIPGPESLFGKLTGSHKQLNCKYVFATIQTLSQPDLLNSFAPNAFDYIIIDEAHRSAAESYQRVLSHFEPVFLLGMTATPERTDGFNVFEIFDFNVPYEIRLHKALEMRMLSPFHYYGVADVTFDDGTTTTDATQIQRLVSGERVEHLLRAIDLYGQAGVPPKGLIFCSHKEEARSLSEELNQRHLRGLPLRTVALTAEDSIESREARVSELEAGNLDYILTVDVFNEGVDIPSVNQVIMLRQTQSAIVFVQQLGRGLRLAEGKDHLVAIDFIGNYSNNYLIPIALFGDQSLNRESIREKLNETVEAGALPGLSSVSFDEISRDRILKSLPKNLDNTAQLRSALLLLRDRVGRTPSLWDFFRFDSVDPVLMATKREHYPALVKALLKVETGLSDPESNALALLSREVLAGKRLHEFVLLDLLRERGSVEETDIVEAFRAAGLSHSPCDVASAIATLTLDGYTDADVKRYRSGVAEARDDQIGLIGPLRAEGASSETFREAVSDLMKTGVALVSERYDSSVPFTPGMLYSRRDAAHIIGWPRATASTIYGLKTDLRLRASAIFVTLDKSDEVDASTAYGDQLLDPSTLRWYSKNNRTTRSGDVAPIIGNQVAVHVFVKKNNAEGADHYYLGAASAHEATDTTMEGSDGATLPVVTMLLRLPNPISQGLFDYLHTP